MCCTTSERSHRRHTVTIQCAFGFSGVRRYLHSLVRESGLHSPCLAIMVVCRTNRSCFSTLHKSASRVGERAMYYDCACRCTWMRAPACLCTASGWRLQRVGTGFVVVVVVVPYPRIEGRTNKSAPNLPISLAPLPPSSLPTRPTTTHPAWQRKALPQPKAERLTPCRPPFRVQGPRAGGRVRERRP